jgi:YD repeat-containing protein
MIVETSVREEGADRPEPTRRRMCSWREVQEGLGRRLDLRRCEDEGGAPEETVFDAWWQLPARVDRGGAVTELRRDGLGRVVFRSDRFRTRELGYGPDGALSFATVREPGGDTRRTEVAYENGRVSRMTSSSGMSASLARDVRGQIRQVALTRDGETRVLELDYGEDGEVAAYTVVGEGRVSVDASEDESDHDSRVRSSVRRIALALIEFVDDTRSAEW